MAAAEYDGPFTSSNSPKSLSSSLSIFTADSQVFVYSLIDVKSFHSGVWNVDVNELKVFIPVLVKQPQQYL